MRHLTRLNIPHTLTVLSGVAHNPRAVLDSLGEANWAFYRGVFGPVAAVDPWQPSALERYRLWRARDAAIKRLDERAIVKFVEINRAVSEAKSWDAGQEKELRRLLEQIEERLGLPPVTAIPTDLTERDFPFAVPKREQRDVRFASSSGVEAKFQSLDVYTPMQGNRQPIVVWIHGGGMKGGDKADPGVVMLKPDFFVARGWVFASINYRLAPDHKTPGKAEDTAAAFAYLHDHAEEFRADRGRIFVIGISAGTQLVAVVATNPRFLARHGKTADMIRAAVILDISSFDIPTLMDQAGVRRPRCIGTPSSPGETSGSTARPSTTW